MILAVIGVALLAGVGVARAQPADTRKQASAAFARAVAAENREDWRAAILEYEEAYRLAPHPDVLYNLGAVYERLGELRAAAEHYQQYLDTKPDAADHAKVERKIAALEQRPSKVAIATTPPGATVIVDGDRRGAAPLELTLTAGTHQLVAEAGGRKVRRTITLAYGEPLAITLPVDAARGTLVVTSNVAGAAITVDGTAVGGAPWSGPLDAGTHVVVVSANGYTTVERTVEVPADGTAQITGALGRPLGYVEPAARGASVVVGIDGGTLQGLGWAATIWYAYRSAGRRAEGGIGTVLASTGVGFAVVGRGYLLTGRIRPYVEVQLAAGGRSQIVHVAGGLMVADLPLGRAGLDLFVEAGAGFGARDGERVDFVPILAGFSTHLATPGAR